MNIECGIIIIRPVSQFDIIIVTIRWKWKLILMRLKWKHGWNSRIVSLQFVLKMIKNRTNEVKSTVALLLAQQQC